MATWRDGKSGRRPKKSQSAEDASPAKPSPRPEKDADAKPVWRGRKRKVKSADVDDRSTWERGRRPERQIDAGPKKLMLWGVFLLSALAVYVYLQFLQPRDTPLLLLAVTNYHETKPSTSEGEFLTSPWPPNAWAAEDLNVLNTQLDNSHIKQTRIDAKNVPDSDSFLDQIKAEIGKAQQGWATNKDVILLYLSCHTQVNQQGEPCLLLSDADPLKDETWLKFDKFVSTLSEANSKAKKVVFLDCGRLDVDPALGLYQNEFANCFDADKSDDKHVRTPHRADDVWVILSHSPGERTWAMPEWGQTPFGLGVKSILEGYSGDVGNNRKDITLDDAFLSLRRAVKEWVHDHRGKPSQTPMIWGPDGRDFTIVRVDKRSDSDDVELLSVFKTSKGDIEKRDRTLHDRSQGLSGPIDYARTSPHVIASSRRLRSQLEDVLIADDEYDAQWRHLTSELEKQNKAIHQPSEADAKVPEWREFWDRLLTSETITRDVLEDQLSKLKNLPSPAPIQVHFARMLRDFIDWDNGNAELGRVVKQALECRDRAEKAANPQDVRVFPWMEQIVIEGDRLRRIAEDHLFVGRAEDLKVAGENFDKAIKCYNDAQTIAQDVSRALALRDELLIDVVEYRSVLTRLEKGWDVVSYADWAKAVGVLDESLRTPRFSANDPQSVDEAHQKVKDAHNKAGKLADDAKQHLLDRINKDDGKNAPSMASIQGLLPATLISALDQERLREKRLRLFEYGETTVTFSRADVTTPQPDKDQSGANASQSSGGHEQHPEERSHHSTVGEGTGHLPNSQTLAQINGEKALLELVQRLARQLKRNDANTTDAHEPRFEAPAQDDGLHAIGGHVRRNLLAYLQHLKHRTPPTIERDAEPAKLEDLINRLQREDALIRLASAGTALKLDVSPLPMQRWRDIEAARLQLWQVRRTLEDFWGSGSDSADPYFAIQADSQLKEASRKLGTAFDSHPEPRTQSLDKELSSLRQRLADLRRSSRESTPTAHVKPVTLTTDSRNPIVERQFHGAGGDVTVTAGADGAMPPGFAFLQITATLANQDQVAVLPDSVRRLPIELTQPEAPVEKSFATRQAIPDSDATKWDGCQLAALTFYRGHVHERRFGVSVSSATSRDLPFERAASEPARITVSGELDVQPVVLFVLDCSGSMSKQTTGSDGRQVSRMIQAKQVLENILDEMAEEEKCHVGLLVYGHRFNVPQRKVGDKNQALPESEMEQAERSGTNQSAFAKKHPDLEVFPDLVKTWNQDVQLVVSLAPLGRPQHVSFLKDRLNELEPWGQTPLYLAIRKAVLTVQSYQQQQPAQIVVITDGMDDLFHTSLHNDSNSEGDRKAARELIKTLNQKQLVRVDVIEIFPENERENENTRDAKVKDLQALIGDFGKYEQATTTRRLEERLDEILRPIQFRVDVEDKELRELGEAVEIRPESLTGENLFPGTPVEVELVNRAVQKVVEKKALLVEGGEDLKLEVVRKTSSSGAEFELRFRGDEREGGIPDEVNKPKGSPFDGPQTARVKVRSDKIIGDDGNAYPVFGISIQNGDQGAFSPRPARVLVEVTPAPEDGRSFSEQRDGTPYVYYERSFVPGQPVPLIRVEAPEWPEGARQAKVRVFFTYDPASDPQLHTLSHEVDTQGGGLHESLAGVTFRVNQLPPADGRFQIVVSEIHEKPERGPAEVRALVFASPSPREVTRRYLWTAAEIQHIFTFDSQAEMDRCQIQVMPRNLFEEKAYRTRVLTVPVRL